ncbi:hypothetical protein FQZ97_710090 [compost metagenome]
MPGSASTAKFFAYSSLACLVTAQSARALAASCFLLVFMMPVASMSQPRPSLGSTMSMGAPSRLVLLARYSKDMPSANSPAPAWRQGLLPDRLYTPMFWCSASMYFQALSSPIIWIQPDTMR